MDRRIASHRNQFEENRPYPTNGIFHFENEWRARLEPHIALLIPDFAFGKLVLREDMIAAILAVLLGVVDSPRPQKAQGHPWPASV